MTTTAVTATPAAEVITTAADIPALGSIAIDCFVLDGIEPVLVDTGAAAGATEFAGIDQSSSGRGGASRVGGMLSALVHGLGR